MHTTEMRAPAFILSKMLTILDLTDFFPFGVDNHDEIGPQEIDESFLFNLSVPIVFYLEEYTNLYVSCDSRWPQPDSYNKWNIVW